MTTTLQAPLQTEDTRPAKDSISDTPPTSLTSFQTAVKVPHIKNAFTSSKSDFNPTHALRKQGAQCFIEQFRWTNGETPSLLPSSKFREAYLARVNGSPQDELVQVKQRQEVTTHLLELALKLNDKSFSLNDLRRELSALSLPEEDEVLEMSAKGGRTEMTVYFPENPAFPVKVSQNCHSTDVFDHRVGIFLCFQKLWNLMNPNEKALSSHPQSSIDSFN